MCRGVHDPARPGASLTVELAQDFYGNPGACDVCGRPLGEEPFFCDAELPALGGRWGLLCRSCTDVEGVQPGWGIAQFYERLESGSAKPTDAVDSIKSPWRCIAGLPPANVTRE